MCHGDRRNKKRILVENQSTNSGENIEFSKKLLHSIDFKFNRVIAVQKPSMILRVKLALDKKWLGSEFFVNSPE
ncbi:YdcF family protein [Leptospira bandrabouensis]|uniref:ElyC/SanA/YdcF family protein n=1 Tax=Leptospira bandrabouensis TaxID=2484903 RepID=UPI0030B880BD|nr:YdcF family protein [Leptospira bandrabouensis]